MRFCLEFHTGIHDKFVQPISLNQQQGLENLHPALDVYFETQNNKLVSKVCQPNVILISISMFRNSYDP